jgi:hypothetical protein
MNTPTLVEIIPGLTASIFIVDLVCFFRSFGLTPLIALFLDAYK